MKFSSVSRLSFPFPALLGAVWLSACAPAALPAPVTQADAVSESKAAQEAKIYAPQAFAEAEKLLAEARYLHQNGRDPEAAAAGDQALAAYEQAFALARLARAQERIERAETELGDAEREVKQLDQLQAQVSADADAYEMRARVFLDTESVKDVDSMTPDRAQARLTAAKQLAAEAALLCTATGMLDKEAKGLKAAQDDVAQLAKELSVGSTKQDLFPRASSLRARCLQELTLARRPLTQASPESAASDELLQSLTETGTLMAYRDDRGIVVNVGHPLTDKGEAESYAQEAMKTLGGAAKAHPQFPVLVVVHTAKSGQEKRATQMQEFAESALKQAGAATVTVRNVQNARPVVFPSIKGADEKNERIEVVFVTPGR